VFARADVALVKDPLELEEVFAGFVHLTLLGMSPTPLNRPGSSPACEKALTISMAFCKRSSRPLTLHRTGNNRATV
jgi:hypothetical protein